MVTQNVNWPLIDEAVAFSAGPRDPQPAPYWVSMIERSRQTFTTARGRQYETDQYQSGLANVTWHNKDGALDPMNTGSPFYPKVIPYRSYRRRAQYPATINVLTADQSTAGAVAGTYGAAGPGTAALAVGTLPPTVAQGGIYALTTTAGPVYSTSLPSTPVSGTVLTQLFGASALPGQAFTAQCAVTNSVSASMKLAIVWVDVNGATISTSTGTPSTGTTSRIISVTGTCPATACGMILELVLNSSPGSASTVTSINWQLERNGTASAYVQPNLWYPIFTGYVERWPLTWAANGLYGLCAVTAVDAIGWMSQQYLRSPGYMEILATEPTHLQYLYCLDEPSTSAQFADATGLQPPIGFFDAGGGRALITGETASVGATLTSLSGVRPNGISGPVAQLAQSATGNGAVLLSLGATSGTVPPTGSAWTRVFAANPSITANPGTVGGIILWVLANSPPNVFVAPAASSYIQAYVALIGPGVLNVDVNLAGSLIASGAGGGPVIDDGQWHIFAFTMSSDGKTLTIYVDGSSVATVTNASDMRFSAVLGEDAYGPPGQSVTTQFSCIAQWNVALSAAEVGLISSALMSGGSGNGVASSASRWADFLRWLQFAGLQAADNYTTGETVAYGPATEILAARVSTGTAGDAALATVVDTEGGTGYVSAGGVVTLKARRSRYNQTTPKVIFGEDPTHTGAEIPYAGDIQFGNDPTRVVSDAELTQTFTNLVTSYVDPTAIANIGDITLQKNINTLSQLEVNDAATYAVARNKTVHQRLQQIHINVGTQPTSAVWLAMLTGELNDFVQVTRRPLSPAATIQLKGFIENIAWTMDNNADAGVDLQISPYLMQQFWQFGSIALTLKNAVVSVGATTAVINPLADAATNPIQANISSAGQPYEWIIEPGTAKEELVTVTFPTAGSTGYTSATLNIGTCLRTDTGATGTGFRFTHSIGAVLQDIGGIVETPAYTIAGLRALLAASSLNTYDLLGSTTVMGY